MLFVFYIFFFFFSSRRRHTRCALVTGVQTCALPISLAVGNHGPIGDIDGERLIEAEARRLAARDRLAELLGAFASKHHRHQRSEEHTSELQSLMRISYAVFCLKKKKTQKHTKNRITQNTRKKNMIE